MVLRLYSKFAERGDLSETDEDIARYSILRDNEQLFQVNTNCVYRPMKN